MKPLVAEINDISGLLMIRAANGLELPFIGYIEVDFKLMGLSFPNMGLVVVKDPDDYTTLRRKEDLPVLIGSNVLRKVNDQLTPDKRSFF